MNPSGFNGMSFTFFFVCFRFSVRIAFQTIKFHQGQKHNPLNANCNAVGGPANLKALLVGLGGWFEAWSTRVV